MTGQLKEILKNFFSESGMDILVDYAEIKAPQYAFPLNWTSMFDLFPESVLQIPCNISYDLPIKNYDIIVLGFQTWFLHLSLPVLSFSGTQDFASLVKGKKVYFIMDCRNAWHQPMKYMEKCVVEAGGIIKGRYVFGSTTRNFTGSISVVHWFFTGKKKLRFFSEAGVSQKEICKANIYGKMLFSDAENEPTTFCPKNIKFLPDDIEKFANIKFKKWATYIIRQKGKRRKTSLLFFRLWLICIITIIAPFIGLVKKIKLI